MAEKDAAGRPVDSQIWDEFCERLKRTGHTVLAAAPADSRATSWPMRSRQEFSSSRANS